MIDRIFFTILLPLPFIVAVAAAVYFAAAWQTSTPSLRRSRILAALWLGASAGILIFCRERVRGWLGFDPNWVTVFLVASAGFLVGLGVVVGLFATIGRAVRDGPLCPRCWYEMAGVEPQAHGSTICPECGTSFDSTRDLARRKRWPLFIAVAVTLQLAGQFWYQVLRADHGGVQNFVPTTALVAGMFSLPAEAIVGPVSPFDVSTLTGRLANNRSANWQKSWALGKSLDALARADHPDSVARSAVILSRCRYEGEIPLAAWKASIRVLCRESNTNSGEALAYLAECYIKGRAISDRPGRIYFAADPKQTRDELADLVPVLLDRLTRASVRSGEWWTSLRLLVLAGDASLPIIDHFEERLLSEDSDFARANTAAVLAMLAPAFPGAPDAAIRSLTLLPASEQPRVFNALIRYIDPSQDMIPSLVALSQCGEPALEVAGSVALLGNERTRCEGAERLIRAIQRQAERGFPDLTPIASVVVRVPDDGASNMLVAFLQDLALNSTISTRSEAQAQLAQIARECQSREPQVLALLDLVGTEEDPTMAERARTLAAEVRTARATPALPRPFAAIR